jgi:cytochrome d ubiquinol oxidase subunit I
MLLIFYGLRIMVAIGFWFLGLSIWTAWAAFRGRLNLASIGRQRRLLLAWFYSIPLGYLAVECGWIVREVGRQPWIVYGLMRTQDAVSNLPASAVAVSLGLFACLYVGLFAAFLISAKRIIARGPDMTLEPPRSS